MPSVMMFRPSGILAWPAVLMTPQWDQRNAISLDLPRDRSDLWRPPITASDRGQPIGGRHSKLQADLDLGRFKGKDYEGKHWQFLEMKYWDRSAGVIVAVGAVTPGYVLCWRDRMRSSVPAVLAVIDEQDLRRSNPPRDLIGRRCSLKFSDCVTMARAILPDLKSIIGSDMIGTVSCSSAALPGNGRSRRDRSRATLFKPKGKHLGGKSFQGAIYYFSIP